VLPFSTHILVPSTRTCPDLPPPKREAERPHRPLTVRLDAQEESAAPAESKVVQDPPMVPPALVQKVEAEAPAAAQPSDVHVVLEEAA
jgi:hypothetical protein